MVDIADKDLPVIKPEDIKIDITAVTSLKEAELAVVKQRWVAPLRSNEQLVLLIKQIPEKIERINAVIADQKEPEKMLVDKIARLKEQYAVCIKEIELRKAASK